MNKPDHYAVLDIDPDADAGAIRAAYRRAARQHHPDRGGSAEHFHRIQQAWEVLGSAQSRAEYDRSRSTSASSAPSADSAQSPGQGNGFTYSRRASGAGTQRGGRTRSSRDSVSRSTSADRPPAYQPPLSDPEPLNLARTSQKVHGEFPARGVFGSGRHARRHRRGVEILEKHVLSGLAAARLFNDVHLTGFSNDRQGRRAAKKSPRVKHVLLCGHTLVLVSALEIPSATASWDGRSLRAAGKSIPLPDLTGHATQLRSALEGRLNTDYGAQLSLQIEAQHMLLAADGDLFHPVVDTQGAGRSQRDLPLAAGRAIGHIANVLGSSSQANLVDRRIMAVLRDQLAAPDA